MADEITLKPIGHVISPAQETVDENWGEVISKIALFPEYAAGLKGLEDFSHVIIVTFLHRAKCEQSRHIQRRPRGLESMPLLGIFAQRAKDRPNPIGITAVELLGVGSDYIEVRGLDAIDGTPVLDIKPYFPDYDKIDNSTVPEWVEELMKGYF